MFKLFAKRAPISEILQYHAILSSDLVNKHYLQVMTNYIKGEGWPYSTNSGYIYEF